MKGAMVSLFHIKQRVRFGINRTGTILHLYRSGKNGSAEIRVEGERKVTRSLRYVSREGGEA